MLALNNFASALLGEADLLTGQIVCPRSPPDALASFAKVRASEEDWIVEGICAYVPQAAWLRNASIKGADICAFSDLRGLTLGPT